MKLFINKALGFLNNKRRRFISKVALIHIPKTGGTYVNQFEGEKTPVIWPFVDLGHTCIIDNATEKNSVYPPKRGIIRTTPLSKIQKYKILSIIRNPFAWLVSYAGHAGAWPTNYLNTDHYDFNNAQKGFDYLVKSIVNRDDIWPNRKFIFFPLFSDNGAMVVDYLARTETLDTDLNHFAQLNDLKYKKKKKQRLGKKSDYRSYYNDKLINLVEETWGREMKLYGYSFNGLNLQKAIIKNEINTVEFHHHYFHPSS